MNKQRSVTVVVFGDGGVGKSSIVFRLVQNIFITEYDPTIEDTHSIELCFDRELVIFDLLDTAGSDSYYPYNTFACQKGNGFLLVYSITNYNSFELLNFLHDHIHQCSPIQNTLIPICVVGNKNDLENQRVVSLNEGSTLASSWNADFIECSAKTGNNVSNLFQFMYELIIEKEDLTTKPIPHKSNKCLLC